MLTAIRTDDREKMVVLSYASPSGDRPRRARDDAEDTGRALRIKFTNAGLMDKENVDPATAMTARKPFATPVREKCTPSRPPLADITPKYVTPNKLTPGRYTLAGKSAMKKSRVGAQILFDHIEGVGECARGAENAGIQAKRRASVKSMR
ncbi:hypothetical protein OT_ostta01g06545 [Ostreococcus tauri]|uniref:Uncharacterized protein n=1 Tax=Ostreococcus tauri TaxID=70448 RepID=A0A090LYF3_OSTTA|nr:hypothetical protein OT_ostta01g06545 [Ostreococcus tauri]CEF96930.1 hypothetical protein OT_ostta01g06545 [Ostreococcus tauri]|eukprot:XP_022838384.1 hypothetical protein OT_ostta01g06545 [Ostreococcus tauri]